MNLETEEERRKVRDALVEMWALDGKVWIDSNSNSEKFIPLVGQALMLAGAQILAFYYDVPTDILKEKVPALFDELKKGKGLNPIRLEEIRNGQTEKNSQKEAESD